MVQLRPLEMAIGGQVGPMRLAKEADHKPTETWLIRQTMAGIRAKEPAMPVTTCNHCQNLAAVESAWKPTYASEKPLLAAEL
jgi:hypothetical protein